MEFTINELETITKFQKWINRHIEENFEIYSSYIKDKRDFEEYETEDCCISLNTIITIYAKEYYKKNIDK